MSRLICCELVSKVPFQSDNASKSVPVISFSGVIAVAVAGVDKVITFNLALPVIKSLSLALIVIFRADDESNPKWDSTSRRISPASRFSLSAASKSQSTTSITSVMEAILSIDCWLTNQARILLR